MPNTEVISGVQVTRLIQSCFKIKVQDVTMWIDPFRLKDYPIGEDQADIVFITHPHADHLDTVSINHCRKENAPIIASPAAADILNAKGIDATPLWEGESIYIKEINITGIPGYNGLHSRQRRFNIGFRINIGDLTIYHSGDTDAIPEMVDVGPIDIAFLPIGGCFVMDENEAALAAQMVKASTVIPMHYGFATGGNPEKFALAVDEKTSVIILDPVLKHSLPKPLRLVTKLLGLLSRRKNWR